MIKPASSMCNMQCSYCFYADESKRRSIADHGIMSRETAAAMIGRIYQDLDDGDEIIFAFQGGEPTLAGLCWFEGFVSRVKAQPVRTTVSYALQTNGILLDDRLCAFLAENDFLVGLSLDGYEELHDRNRLDDSGTGTYSAVIKRKRLLEKYKVDYNILSVLTKEAARHPQKMWDFIQKENIKYIQFIPCLGSFENRSDDTNGLSPRGFYRFYSELFTMWKQQMAAGGYTSVKLFEDIIDLFAFGRAAACGINGQCCPQYVVEANGSIYPCDFYCVDEYHIGNITEMTLRQAFESSVSVSFRRSRNGLPGACLNCRYRPACNGGCKRQWPAMYVDTTGFCGFRALLDSRLNELLDIAKKYF
jgi:uncharacterized protein